MGYRFGEAIKKIRKEKHLSQESLAKMSGVKRSTIDSYELNTRMPSAANIGKIAHALDVSVQRLYDLAYQWGGCTPLDGIDTYWGVPEREFHKEE